MTLTSPARAYAANLTTMAEKMHPAFKTTTRVCVICGKALRRMPNGKNETTYGFRNILARNGIAGDKAHPSCVAELGSFRGRRM